MTLVGPERAEVRDSEDWPGWGGKNPPLLCWRQGAVLSLKKRYLLETEPALAEKAHLYFLVSEILRQNLEMAYVSKN